MGAPVVMRAIDDIISSATAAHVGIGIIGSSAEALQPYAARGVNFLTVGADGALFMHGARQLFSRSTT